MWNAIKQNRWWIYQQERFPVFAHGTLIAVFSLAAVAYSAVLGGRYALELSAFAVAFATTFGFFLLLRIADEFKDFEDDCRYRAYRPVPRGLIGLNDLRYLAIIVLALQMLAALLLHAPLAMLLVLVWVYLGLMTVEFFAGSWLRRHPTPYMLSHMLIMPLIQLYASACDWLPQTSTPPAGLSWFLAASYANGLVIEIGRKIRVPEDEEPGVETYSALWGRKTACLVWLSAMGAAGVFASLAADRVAVGGLTIVLLSLGWIISALLAFHFLTQTRTQSGKAIETCSGLWTLASYLLLGPVALLMV